VEKHHRGQGLIVKTISPPYQGAGIVCIVEDSDGNADKLTIHNHTDSSILANVPEGCVLAVKEPYYKYNGAPEQNDFLICVDHPSDVILLRFGDSIIPQSLRLGPDQPIFKEPAEWRNVGDKAFLERDFPTAIFWYVGTWRVIWPGVRNAAHINHRERITRTACPCLLLTVRQLHRVTRPSEGLGL
jgi:hypothetical protein